MLLLGYDNVMKVCLNTGRIRVLIIYGFDPTTKEQLDILLYQSGIKMTEMMVLVINTTSISNHIMNVIILPLYLNPVILCCGTSSNALS